MEWAVGQLYPVIPEKLFITTHVCRAQTQREIQKHSDLFFFSSREPESYMSFCKDFGPVDLAGVMSFCKTHASADAQ
ncbi:hypothetical protein T484DRAFT_1839417 [Baffinella frigidus]|nr:hypothetical protein T484DRAFT_1839417 [Cryptophyta sp. CCMP2293]